MKKTSDAKIGAVRKMQSQMQSDMALAKAAHDGHTKLSGSLLGEMCMNEPEGSSASQLDDEVNYQAENAGVSGNKGPKPKKAVSSYTRFNDPKMSGKKPKGY